MGMHQNPAFAVQVPAASGLSWDLNGNQPIWWSYLVHSINSMNEPRLKKKRSFSTELLKMHGHVW
jgi:hypothetical protein